MEVTVKMKIKTFKLKMTSNKRSTHTLALFFFFSLEVFLYSEQKGDKNIFYSKITQMSQFRHLFLSPFKQHENHWDAWSVLELAIQQLERTLNKTFHLKRLFWHIHLIRSEALWWRLIQNNFIQKQNFSSHLRDFILEFLSFLLWIQPPNISFPPALFTPVSQMDFPLVYFFVLYLNIHFPPISLCATREVK